MAHRAWSWRLTYILIVMSTVGWRGREDGEAATQQEHPSLRGCGPIRSGPVRSDSIGCVRCGSDRMGAVHHAASSEFVKAGTVARTTVEDRMNEYTNGPRRGRGSVEGQRMEVEPWRMHAWREDVWCGVWLRAQLVGWLNDWSALLLRTES